MSAEPIEQHLRHTHIFDDYCNGHGDIGMLADRHGMTYAQTKAIIDAHCARREKQRGDGAARREKYIGGLEWDLKQARDTLADIEGESPKMTCLKQITALREKIAVAEGVAIVIDPEVAEAQTRIIAIPIYSDTDPIGEHLEKME